jgi:hypothetical protein
MTKSSESAAPLINQPGEQKIERREKLSRRLAVLIAEESLVVHRETAAASRCRLFS